MQANESERLARLRELLVLDSSPEPVFDSIVQLASQVCGAPIALVSLIDAERQWFKANVGLPGVHETTRDVAFCAHAIDSDALMQVPDASRDARFAGNPLVTVAPDIRFYAGAPLVLANGARVGTLCVIDRQARQLDAGQAELLQSLAAIASQALELRRDLINKALSVRSEYEHTLAESESRYRAIVEEQTELVSLAQADGELVYVNPAYARHFGRTPAQMIGANLFDHIAPADRDAVHQQIASVLGGGRSLSGENRMVTADGSERWVAWTNAAQQGALGKPLLHSVGRDITERKRAEQALRASQSFLLRTGRVAGVGGWELDARTQALTWSDETRRIHEVGPGYVPTLEHALDFYAPESRALMEAAVREALESGKPWDLELPFITAAGRHIWVRTVGEAEFEGAAPVRLVGAFQDITERKRLEQRVADSERFVRLITDHLPLRIAYVDKQRRYQFVNLAHSERFARSRAQIIGRTRSELTQGVTDAKVEAHVDAVLLGAPQRFEFEERVDGALRRIESQLVPDVADSGEVRGFFSTGIDITERSAAERALRSVTEAIPANVVVVGADRRYRFVNRSFERWAGIHREHIIGRTMAAVLGPAEHERSLPWAERALAGESVNFELAYAGPGPARHLAISYTPLWRDDGSVDGFIGMAQDITQHKQEEVRLLQLAQRDALTGLLNRAGFEAVLGRQMDDGAGATLALLYIDLDFFKPVNDRHGHPTGDRVLQMFGQRLQQLVRPTDAVARLGGDEFAVLLVGVRESAHARTVADKVIAAAQAPFEVGTLRLAIGASVGVAHGADPVAGWGDLVARADQMLYRAKQTGRGRQAGGMR